MNFYLINPIKLNPIEAHSKERVDWLSKKIISDLGGVGLFGVEFFIKKNNDIIFSELSPRPHDTGLVT